MELKDNVALVTGAASGLGEATARHLHSRGASLALFDRNAEGVTKLAQDLGERALPLDGDALDETEVAAAIDQATQMGPLRAVVACAGGTSRSERTLHRDGTPHDLGHFIETLNLNVTTTFNTLRLAAAAMARLDPDNDGERGVIVTTSSIAGSEGQIGQIAYGTAKAAISGMTLIAARDLASSGIRVATIAPGTIGTQAWDAAPADLRNSLEAKVPFPRRFGHPEEFARLAEHLITNPYINGTVVRLDGAIRFDPR